MQLPNLSLSCLLLELNPVLLNSRIDKVQELGKNFFKLRILSRSAQKQFVLSPEAIFLSSYKLSALQNSSGFGAFLNKYLSGKKILSLEQHGSDRIAVISFEDKKLVLEFFADSNFVLIDSTNKILGCLRNEEWKDRKIRKGEDYKFPASKGMNPATASEDEFIEAVEKSEKQIFQAIVSAINIAPVFLEEIFFTQNLDKKAKAKDFPKKQLKQIFSEINALYSEISAEKLKPVIVNETLLPFPLKHLKEKPARNFPSLSEALDELVSMQFLSKESAEVSSTKSKEIERIEFSLNQQLEAKARFEEEARESKAKAEFIYANMQKLQQAIEILKKAEKNKEKPENIMYNLNSLGLNVLSVDLKKKQFVIEAQH
ncbi:MAG: NFACT family protein [Candidatus Diapherotrites archaeon]